MKHHRTCVLAACLGAAIAAATHAAVITVTTTDNVSPPAGQTSLLEALTSAQPGDVIEFNIPGDGPHVIATPAGGYPYITQDNLTIDGYSQPDAAPNSNPILAANNAQLQIVLDSRNRNARLMDFAGTNPNDVTGYGDSEAAILGILEAQNVTIRGLSLLGVQQSVSGADLYGISFAKGANGKVQGCWIGVSPDGQTLAGPRDGITGFRYRVRDAGGTTLETILIEDLIIGVEPGATDAPAQFNVITGIPAIPIIIEGQNNQISGNFVQVLPSGIQDYNPVLDPNVGEGVVDVPIGIGRSGNNVIIGVDGDGVNDDQERNVIGGTLPSHYGGYDHTIEFYGQSPGTNIVIAGNYIGVGVDGVSRFTNGVPMLNAAGGSAQYRVGSNLDGVSDELEGNVVFNYHPNSEELDPEWPEGYFFPYWVFLDWPYYPNGLDFFDELDANGIVSLRGNTLVNNLPFPVSPTRTDGLLANYYTKALANPAAGLTPVLSTLSTVDRISGTVPLAKTAEWPTTIIDIYAADLESITTGSNTFLVEFPNGWVLGRGYMGSFVENGPDDLNPAAGAFEFDITGLDLKGSQLTVTANYSKGAADDPNALVLTSPFADPVNITFRPGGVETVGLEHIASDTVIINPELAALGNWEPYASVLGNSVFLIEGNTFAEDSWTQQRYVVALQPVAGGPMTLAEGFFADDGTPFRGPINLSRQNGNPGRVAGDQRPGATRFMVGGEASPHALPEFQSDGRWNLGFNRLVDGRYGTIQIYELDVATLTQTPLCKAQDSANGRLTSGTAPNNQITRFGGDIVCLDNGNFVSVVDDRSAVRDPANLTVATIFAPDGSIVKESFLVEKRDIWSNVAAYRGGFCVRVHENLHFFDNDGNELGVVNQSTSGYSFDTGRSDGTRIAGHINGPYVFLAGKVTDAPIVRIAVWDSRDRSFVAAADVSEGAFAGDFDRATVAVDALNRVTVAWVSQPTGYEARQVAARVLAFDGDARTFTPLTRSFFPFVNAAESGGIESWQMTVAMTTRQICVAAKGRINLENQPDQGANSPNEINFFTVITHPDPADDPTTPVGQIFLSIARGAGNTLNITWEATAATLESAPTVTGPWTELPEATSPWPVTPTGDAQFYRLKQ